MICPTYLCDPADLAFVRGAVAGSRQWALLNWASAVQGDKGGSAQVKWIVGVVVQLVGICQGLLTSCQNLAGLNGKERFNMVNGIVQNCSVHLKMFMDIKMKL